MKTYILVQAVPLADRQELVHWVMQVPGVHRVEAVTGPYDLIAEVTGDDGATVLGAIAELGGVLRAIDAPVAGTAGREPAAA